MIRKINWEYFLLACICAVYLGITAYRLFQLPGEWYGDISIEHREVVSILSGQWPWQFNLSAGPAYHYIVAGFAYFLGASYNTYKLASVVTGLASILLIYLLGKEFAGPRVGLLSALAGAVSFWMILFARLGSSPQILSPVLSPGAVYFLLRFKRTRRWYDAAISMVFAGWGLFTYPSTFVIPIIVLGLILWQVTFFRDRALWWRALAITIGILLPFAIWFGYTVHANPAFTQAGYVGSKIAEQRQSPVAIVETFATNMVKALGMFQVHGDEAFRTNIPGKPMLDPLSGVMMDLGFMWIFLNSRLRSRWAFIIMPALIMLMPSAAPGIAQIEIPSASRSLGVAPFIFVLVGCGIDAVWIIAQRWLNSRESLKKQMSRLFSHRAAASADSDRTIPLTGARPAGESRIRGSWLNGVMIGLVVLVIGYFNITQYFNTYAWQLPGHNQPWDLLIAQYLQTLPSHTVVKMTACCWEDPEQPSSQVINYHLETMHSPLELSTKAYTKSCQELKPGARYVIIFPPNENSPLARQFRDCFLYSAGQMHYDHLGQAAFYSLSIDLR